MDGEIYKIYKHNPPHLFLPNAKYMVTGAIFMKRNLLKFPAAKEKILTSLFKASQKYGWILEDWVILDNHYHLMMSAPENPFSLKELIKEVHKFTALWLKKNNPDAKNVKRVFWNYWDTCISYESSYYARLNYIFFNCVKHGYVESPEKYIYGSYFWRLKLEKDWLDELKNKYPWDRVRVKDDF